MKLADRKVMLCNCEKSMSVDGEAIAKALGSDQTPVIHNNLCRMELQAFSNALDHNTPLLIACTQEAPLFTELAEERGSDTPLAFLNIRERAGWTESRDNVTAKMSALLAGTVLEPRAAGSRTIVSDGMCLVYGAGQATLDAAIQLSSRLNVSLLLTDHEDIVPPATVMVPIYRGHIVRAAGSFGAFEVEVDDYAPVVPSSKDGLQFQMAKNGAVSNCSIILDMSGGMPLFPGHRHRDGYFHVDPSHPAGVQKALFDAADLVGEFEKPLYVEYDANICAHSRNGLTGCSNCIDTCPAGAITPDGDYISVDSGICGGCGTCSAVCPSGAIGYAYERRDDRIRRVQTLLSTYIGAGGETPKLLFHDQSRGAEMIGAMARFGRGLPGSVLPVSLYSVTEIGHDLLAAAVSAGAEHIFVLCPPEQREEIDPLTAQKDLIVTLLAGLGFDLAERVHILNEQDPDILETALWDCQPAPLAGKTKRRKSATPSLFDPVGGKRAVARTAFSKLRELAPAADEIIALPPSAPYGRVAVDVEGCTLCLACVGCCPADALHDNPDRLQLSFVEAACLQCGLCATTCPEKVITLEPRFNFSNAALSPEVLHEDEPAECLRCGKPFGSRAAVERVTAQFAGKHSMFMESDRAKLIHMCDDCRVIAQSEMTPDPYALGQTPRPRTTDDYLEAQRTLQNNGKGSDDDAARLRATDFLKDD